MRFLQGKSEKGELETRFKSDSDKEKPTKKRHQKLSVAEAMYEVLAFGPPLGPCPAQRLE